MKNIIAVAVVALLLLSGCAQADVPKEVSARYDGEDYSSHRTLTVCSSGDEKVYLVGIDVEVDGPVYYYGKDGNFLGTRSFINASVPVDVSGYRCELLKESRP